MNEAPLKLIKKLHKTKTSKDEGLCIVEGRKCVHEAFHKQSCAYLLITQGNLSEFEQYKHKTKFYIVDENDLKEISQFNQPEGVLGVFNRPLLSKEPPKGQNGEIHLALFQWNDPNNIGSSIRTAHGLGIKSITLIGNSPDALSAKVIRTSMASTFHLPLHHIEDLSQFNKDNWHILYAELGGLTIEHQQKIHTKKPILLCMGSESHGFSPIIPPKKQCISIPIKETLDSYSAPIAAAILMHHLKHCISEV